MDDECPNQKRTPANDLESNVSEGAAISETAIANLNLASKVVRVAAVVVALLAVATFLQLVSIFRFYNQPFQSTFLTMTIVANVLKLPIFVFVSWMSWKYANALTSWKSIDRASTEHFIERLTKYWLALGLFIFAFVFSLALTFGAATTNY